MATLEIQPEALLIKNGFPIPRPGSSLVTQDDFPGVIAAIERAADAELGAGAGLPAARPNERSRSHGRPARRDPRVNERANAYVLSGLVGGAGAAARAD